MVPMENDCDFIKGRSKPCMRKLLWKYTSLLFLKELQADLLKPQPSLPKILLQGCESLGIQVCSDSLGEGQRDWLRDFVLAMREGSRGI